MPSRTGTNDDPIRRTILERRILRLRADQRGSIDKLRSRSMAKPSLQTTARPGPCRRPGARAVPGTYCSSCTADCAGRHVGARRAPDVACIRPARGANKDLARGWASVGPHGRPVFLLINHHCGGGRSGMYANWALPCCNNTSAPCSSARDEQAACCGRNMTTAGVPIWCRQSANEERVDRAIPDPAAAGPCPRPSHDGPAGRPDRLPGRARRALRLDDSRLLHDLPRVNLIGAGGNYCGEPDAGVQPLPGPARRRSGPAGKKTIAAGASDHRRLGGAAGVCPERGCRRRLARYFPGLRVPVRPHAEALPSRKPGCPLCSARGSASRSWARSSRSRARSAGLCAGCRPASCHWSFTSSAPPTAMRPSRVSETSASPAGIGRKRSSSCWRPALSPGFVAVALSRIVHVHAVGRDGGPPVRLLLRLGAQAERVRAWGWGRALAMETSPESINDALVDGADAGGRTAAPPPPRSAFYPDILTSVLRFHGHRGAEQAAQLACPAAERPGITPTSASGGTMHIFTSITANYLRQGRSAGAFGQARPSRSRVSRRSL